MGVMESSVEEAHLRVHAGRGGLSSPLGWVVAGPWIRGRFSLVLPDKDLSLLFGLLSDQSQRYFCAHKCQFHLGTTSAAGGLMSSYMEIG